MPSLFFAADLSGGASNDERSPTADSAEDGYETAEQRTAYGAQKRYNKKRSARRSFYFFFTGGFLLTGVFMLAIKCIDSSGNSLANIASTLPTALRMKASRDSEGA